MAPFEKSLGATAMALGLLMGSVAQFLMQLPGLRGVPVTFLAQLAASGSFSNCAVIFARGRRAGAGANCQPD